MLTKSQTMDFPASSPTNGTPFRVAGYTNLTLQITNAGTGVAITLEGTVMDSETLNLNPAVPPANVVWAPVTTWVTADGIVLIDILQNLAWLRIRTTAFGSGTPAAVLRYTAQ